MAETEDKPTCGCCGGDGLPVQQYREGLAVSGEKQEYWDLCYVCAATFISSRCQYPRTYSDVVNILDCLGGVGNLLLTEIRALRAEVQELKKERP